MPTYTATMKVTHREEWEVEAENEQEARAKFSELTDDVVDDDTGGEVTDWEIVSVKKVRASE